MASDPASLPAPRRWLWLPASLLATGAVWLGQALVPVIGVPMVAVLSRLLVPSAIGAALLALALLIAFAVRARLHDHLPVVSGEEPLLAAPRLPATRRRQPMIALAGLEAESADPLGFNLAVLAAAMGEVDDEGGVRRPRPACILSAGALSTRLGVRAEELSGFLATHPYCLTLEVVGLATWHPSGCEIFALERGERAVEYLKLLVPTLRRLYDLVVVACDVEDRFLADSAAELSDAFLLVGPAGQRDVSAAEDWLERIWSLGLEQKSALVITQKSADRDRLAEVAARPIFRAELPSEPATAILDAKAVPWSLDQRFAGSRQLELAIRQLLPDLFRRRTVDAA